MGRDYSKERRKIRTVRIGDHDLDKEIRGMLTLYAAEVTEAIDAAGEDMVAKLVRLTKATAPVRKGPSGGGFKKHIAAKTVQRPSGNLYIWYVKPPDHRITHLLVHGHAGNNHQGNPFLKNALETVLPEYEKKVKEALKNG